MDLAVQKAIRALLIADPAVIALVPAASILDRHQRPAPDPAIILGEAQVLDEGTSLARTHARVAHTLHVWKREPSLEGAKTILGAIRRALRSRLDLGQGLHAADTLVTSSRVLRDPDGETSHGVLTVEVLVAEVAP